MTKTECPGLFVFLSVHQLPAELTTSIQFQ